MGDSFDIRPYQRGDEIEILKLFQQSFHKPMSLDYWNWQFQDNPVAGHKIYLAWDGDILAAHYAVSPVVLSILGETYLTALTLTIMTHPDYRGQGLFLTLANSLNMSLAEQGYLMVWGFPNDKSHRGFIRDVKWQEIYEIPMFYLNMNILSSIPGVSGRIVELNNFDERVDALWENVRTNHQITTKRDSKYLNWRFCLKPQSNYRILGYVDGDRLLGYVIFKKYQAAVDIVDILAIREKKIGLELVWAVLNFCRQSDIKSVNTWLPVNHPLHLDLEKLGFRNTHPVIYMGARLLKRFNEISDITNIRKWYFTMSDSDVF